MVILNFQAAETFQAAVTVLAHISHCCLLAHSLGQSTSILKKGRLQLPEEQAEWTRAFGYTAGFPKVLTFRDCTRVLTETSLPKLLGRCIQAFYGSVA